MLEQLEAVTSQDGPIRGTAILRVVGEFSNLEPSGLTVYSDAQGVSWYYMVSDNGIVARRKTDLSDDWQTDDLGKSWGTDFEGVTVAGNKLMIGLEASVQQKLKNAPRYAEIRRFNPANTRESPLGSFTHSRWILKDINLRGKGGLEALTFLPDGAYPAAWGTSSHFGGLFLVSFQADPGKVYVYDLPKIRGTRRRGITARRILTSPFLRARVSDMYYSADSGVLYVLYDQGVDWLQELALNPKRTAFRELRRSRLPYAGYEAVVECGTNLCLGLDPTPEDQEQNGLDYNFIICMPWVKLDRQSWAD